MMKPTLKDIVFDYVVITELEICDGALEPGERFTPQTLLECLPVGTSITVLESILDELANEAKLSWSKDKIEGVHQEAT